MGAEALDLRRSGIGRKISALPARPMRTQFTLDHYASFILSLEAEATNLRFASTTCTDDCWEAFCVVRRSPGGRTVVACPMLHHPTGPLDGSQGISHQLRFNPSGSATLTLLEVEDSGRRNISILEGGSR